MQYQLDNVCRLLSTGRANEPKIDLGSIYGDGIRGFVNNWVDYPYTPDGPSLPPPYSRNDQGREEAGAASKSSSGPELYWKTSPGQSVTTAKRKKAEAGSSSDESAVVRKHPRQATSDSDSEPDQGGGRMAAFEAQLALAQELSPTEADPDSAPPDPELHYKMVHFILYALQRDGDAMSNYRKDFIEMGHHVNVRDDKAFRAVKHRCYNSLALRSSRYGFPIPSTPAPSSDQVKLLLDWLDDAISDEAYALLDRHYAYLAELVSEAEKEGFGREEFEIRRADFYAAAFCVADGIKRDCPRRPPTLCAEGVPRLSQAYRSFR